MTTKPTPIAATVLARPAHISQQQPSPTLAKRGHIRSASLENANSFISKNTLGLPVVQPSHTGTLKSRNEQKRMRNKFGSHNNLEDYMQPGRTKFQNIRQIFEITKKRCGASASAGGCGGGGCSTAGSVDDVGAEAEGHLLQSLPPPTTATATTTLTAASGGTLPPPHMTTRTQPYAQQQLQTQSQPQQPHLHTAYQQQYTAAQQQQQQQLPRKPTPTFMANGCGSRGSISEMNERLSIVECAGMEAKQKMRQQQQQQQQQQQLQHLQAQRQHSQPQQQQQQHQTQPQPQHPHPHQHQHQIQQQQQQQHHQHQQRSSSGLAHLPHVNGIGENAEQSATATPTTATTAAATTTTTNLLRPIAFKPIPFEPDYSIPNRYCDVASVGDRYGSTPSLAPVQGSTLRFGSTTDLRHGGGSSAGAVGVGVATGAGVIVGGYSSSNYCNSLMARRRGSRSLKINDSMESIRHTPDSDAHSQSITIKSNCSNGNGSAPIGGSSAGKYALSEQCDMTPSPSDSGISDLEAALKDRDSELSYLRQTMEHNEKDKETFWENETKRLKTFYEGQQREYLLKMKKMEQMLAMQQFQFKQHKLRHNDQANKLREQMADLKNENEILRSNNGSLKNSERNLKDSVAYIEEQLRESQNAISSIKAQLEESEWKVCERNGEIALLKSQLKEANVEITMKEHAIVHLRNENTNAETQIYESLQENHKITLQQQQVEAQKARTEKQSETELKQLNKIVILKDQVILALTSELAKLRKELSDLAIFHEYGEEPSGRFIRLKQQLDNLTDICNRTRKHTHKTDLSNGSAAKEKVIDDTNLEVIMNCLKIAPPLDDDSDAERELATLNAEKRLAKMSADIQNFVYGAQNLPDVAVNHSHHHHHHHKPLKYAHPMTAHTKLEESTLDTLIEESANYAEEIGKLRKQLDDVRVNFELEKRQWCEEKEKVLSYQKQLQAHYINMYQKLRSLEGSNEV